MREGVERWSVEARAQARKIKTLTWRRTEQEKRGGGNLLKKWHKVGLNTIATIEISANSWDDQDKSLSL